MLTEDKVKLLKELVKDWRKGALSDYSAMLVVSSIVSPIKLSKADKLLIAKSIAAKKWGTL